MSSKNESIKNSIEREIDRLEKFDGNLHLDDIYFTKKVNVKNKNNSKKTLINLPNIDVNVKFIIDDSKSNSNDSKEIENNKSQLEYLNDLLLKSSKNIRVFIFFSFF